MPPLAVWVQAQGAERTVLRHQASTWELLHVLFSAIDGEQPLYRAGASGAAAMEDGEDVQLDRLAAFKRRAHMSHWLRDRARPHVETALRGSGGGGGASEAIAAQLLALLSGHQLAAAAALAAATGNPRLASLLAQAGTKAVGQAELAEQLAVWDESGCERHISEALRRVYLLLAGQVDAVTPSMQASQAAVVPAVAGAQAHCCEPAGLPGIPKRQAGRVSLLASASRAHPLFSPTAPFNAAPAAAGLAPGAGCAPLVRLPAHRHR